MRRGRWPAQWFQAARDYLPSLAESNPLPPTDINVAIANSLFANMTRAVSQQCSRIPAMHVECTEILLEQTKDSSMLRAGQAMAPCNRSILPRGFPLPSAGFLGKMHAPDSTAHMIAQCRAVWLCFWEILLVRITQDARASSCGRPTGHMHPDF